MRNISLDLDNTVFDLEPVYKMGFKNFPQYEYQPPKTWAVYDTYPRDVADNILALFKTIANYETPLLDVRYPSLIQKWRQKHNIKIITSRKSFEPDITILDQGKERKISWVLYHTFKQVRDAGMDFSLDDIVDVRKNSKLEAIKKENIDLVIDDSPIVVEECLEAGIDCVMISTERTIYNHHLRNKAQWAKNLFEVAKMKSL